MTVRDRVGRTRYVAFRVEPPQPRPAVAGALPPPAKLTRFDGAHGIVRTGHRDVAALLAWMGEARRGARFTPLATSGTIRKAAEALPAGSRARTRDPRPPSPRA